MNISGAYYAFETSVNIGSVVQLVQGHDNYVMNVNEISEFLYIFDTNEPVLDSAIFGDLSIVATSPTVGSLVVRCYNNNVLVWSQLIYTLNIVLQYIIFTSVY